MPFDNMIMGTLLILLVFLLAGSLLSLSSHPHWFIRTWDFPRVQIVVVAWMLVCCRFTLVWWFAVKPLFPDWPFWSIAIFLSGWHGFRIFPYTMLAARQSVASQKAKNSDVLGGKRLKASQDADPGSFRMVVSNVQMENHQFDTWTQVMQEANPDILVMLEPDQHWLDQISAFIDQYEYQVLCPQDNWYGIAMISRLPIENYKVRFLAQEDIPSVDARIRLRNGECVRIVAVHPRPPEPIRDNDSDARDAELTLWGLELAEDETPVVIGGDLNDVAWSQTTRLFLRTTGLLDPRRGRGFFNTFHANHRWMRFPLDHVFHSKHFTVSRLQRLQYVGSDHFPMLIELLYNPSRKSEHGVMTSKEGDDEAIQERLDHAEESDECMSVASRRIVKP
ncbi:MAG: endonuclease/exonuclease/phosphatase family protein [Pirellulaceae bacterium]